MSFLQFLQPPRASSDMKSAATSMRREAQAVNSPARERTLVRDITPQILHIVTVRIVGVALRTVTRPRVPEGTGESSPGSAALRRCEINKGRPQRGHERVARGKRSAAPGLQTAGNGAPAGAREAIAIEGILSPLPGLDHIDFGNPGLRFACPGLFSGRRSAARPCLFHTFFACPGVLSSALQGWHRGPAPSNFWVLRLSRYPRLMSAAKKPSHKRGPG